MRTSVVALGLGLIILASSGMVIAEGGVGDTGYAATMQGTHLEKGTNGILAGFRSAKADVLFQRCAMSAEGGSAAAPQTCASGYRLCGRGPNASCCETSALKGGVNQVCCVDAHDGGGFCAPPGSSCR
jgi:hypothetical protein